MSGEIVGIYIATEEGGPMQLVDQANIVIGKGIEGDRYFDDDNDSQISLIDLDVIDRVNAETGWTLTPADLRRNIATRGIDLNQWESGRFVLGSLMLEGFELCEPCGYLGKLLQNKTRDAPGIVKILTHKAGLRARILQTGTVRTGDPVSPA